jgi:hypothetical protein
MIEIQEINTVHDLSVKLGYRHVCPITPRLVVGQFSHGSYQPSGVLVASAPYGDLHLICQNFNDAYPNLVPFALAALSENIAMPGARPLSQIPELAITLHLDLKKEIGLFLI